MIIPSTLEKMQRYRDVYPLLVAQSPNKEFLETNPDADRKSSEGSHCHVPRNNYFHTFGLFYT